MLAYSFVVITLPVSSFFCVKIVKEYERLVIFRFGHLKDGRAFGPGMFIILPWIDAYNVIDLRTRALEIEPQRRLSNDSVTVDIDAVIYHRTNDAIAYVTNISLGWLCTKLLAVITLRNVLGTKSLSEILSERDSISRTMHSYLNEATKPWGIQVDRVEMKDVKLPAQMQRAMAAEAEAVREARAKVVAAEGEKKDSDALRMAAEVISKSPQALQLRYLQTLNTIAAEKNSTIVFPLPMELFSSFSSLIRPSAPTQLPDAQQQAKMIPEHAEDGQM